MYNVYSHTKSWNNLACEKAAISNIMAVSLAPFVVIIWPLRIRRAFKGIYRGTLWLWTILRWVRCDYMKSFPNTAVTHTFKTSVLTQKIQKAINWNHVYSVQWSDHNGIVYLDMLHSHFVFIWVLSCTCIIAHSLKRSESGVAKRHIKRQLKKGRTCKSS